MYRGVEIQLLILDLGTTWSLAVSFTPRPLYPGVRAPDTLCIGGWVGSRVGMNTGEEKKPNHCP